MNNKELINLIADTTQEIMKKNEKLLDSQLSETINISVQISAAVTIKVLEQLGAIEKVIKD